MKRILSYSLQCLITLCFFHAALYAQEIQVPIDNENKIESIDADLEKKIGLFSEYQGFIEARLFMLNDTSYSFEITYKADDRVYKKRKLLNLQQVLELRKKVTRIINVESPKLTLNHEGRAELLIGSTLLSLIFWGPSAPNILGVDDFETATALYLFTSAAGFLIPYLATKNAPVTEASASLGVTGGVLGLAHGAFIYGAGEGEDQETLLSLMSLTSIIEFFAGYHIARGSNMSAGKAGVISTMGAFGIGYGAGVGALLDADEFSSYSILMLLGSGAGLVAGNIIANSQSYTRGDARVFSDAGIIGAYIPLMLLFATETDDPKSYAGALMAGATIGFWIGDRMVVGKDFTKSQGTYISLGTLAGGLIGAGIGFLASSDHVYKPVCIMSAVGATGGFALLYSSFADDAKTPASMGSVELNVNPAALSANMYNKRLHPALQRYIPAVTLSYKF